jgi:hypothetical protein
MRCYVFEANAMKLSVRDHRDGRSGIGCRSVIASVGIRLTELEPCRSRELQASSPPAWGLSQNIVHPTFSRKRFECSISNGTVTVTKEKGMRLLRQTGDPYEEKSRKSADQGFPRSARAVNHRRDPGRSYGSCGRIRYCKTCRDFVLSTPDRKIKKALSG